MKQIFKRPDSLHPAPFRFCPGCGHSLLHRLLAECVDSLGIRERTIGIAPVGCAVFAYEYFNFDIIEVAHGRPPAAATGMKRARPENIVISYQGDGDLAAIGMGEIIHAANRGENISVFFVNNATYGMTGGQMAPTTLIGQKTATTPGGRSIAREGYPLRICELISTIEGASLVARTALDSIKGLRKTKSLMEKALRYQVEGKGFSLIEVLSPCPTDWYMSPEESMSWISSVMVKTFPLGTFVDKYDVD